MIEPSGLEWLNVNSTLPSVPYPQQEIRTSRLILRNLRPDDLQPLFSLRSQPEVAAWSPTGKPEADIEKTKKFLEKRIEGRIDKNCTYAICLTTGEFIGLGGAHTREGQLGWPELGYSLLKEYWGKGYATEFLQAFLQQWWDMPRVDCEVRVDAKTVQIGCIEGSAANERLVAITVEENLASRGVMSKNGMDLAKIWRVEDMRDESRMADLFCYTMIGPEKCHSLHFGA